MCKFNFLFCLCVVILLGCTPDYIKTDIMLAGDGDAKAQCRLGDSYYYGKGVFKNLPKAVVWYTKAAKQGNAEAQYRLGMCFLVGQGVNSNIKLAIEWFEKSAEQGNTDALKELGDIYRWGTRVEENYSKAVDYYAEAYRLGRKFDLEYEAKKGNSYAQYKLAECLGFGKEAEEWLVKLAEKNLVEAQYILADMYLNGKEYEKAVAWFTKAAEQNDANSQAKLGALYDWGLGVQQDFKKAVELWEKSIENDKNGGNPVVLFSLGECYRTGRGVSKNDNTAFSYYYKSAKLGYDEAQFKVGLFYIAGIGGEQNDKLGKYWINKAADQGNEDAKEFLNRR